MFGKKNGTDSAVRGGQILRSAFSNNTSRGRVYELAERLDNYLKKSGAAVKENALDQALFAEVLEKSGLYETQAITGLKGQMEQAVKKGMGLVEGIKNPLKGAANVAGTVVEKIQNISPEAKKKVLQDLLKGIKQ